MLWLLLIGLVSAKRLELHLSRAHQAPNATNGTNGTNGTVVDESAQIAAALSAAAVANAAADRAEASTAAATAAAAQAMDYKRLATDVFEAAQSADITSQQNLQIAEKQTPPFIYAHKKSVHKKVVHKKAEDAPTYPPQKVEGDAWEALRPRGKESEATDAAEAAQEEPARALVEQVRAAVPQAEPEEEPQEEAQDDWEALQPRGQEEPQVTDASDAAFADQEEPEEPLSQVDVDAREPLSRITWGHGSKVTDISESAHATEVEKAVEAAHHY